MATILLPIRNVNLNLPGLLAEMYDGLSRSVLAEAGQALNAQLEAAVTQELGRAWHERRAGVLGTCRFECPRCGSRGRRQFTRNGYRRRGLTLALGEVALALPRLVCTCGGSVRLHLPGLRPGQRLGDDLASLTQHWSGLAYSLRQLKAELDASLHTSLGLRSLNERLRQVAAQVPAWYERGLEEVPPVVVLDALWLTLMLETPEIQRDERGRRRRIKQRARLPLMVALGVWPEDGRSAVLDWELGQGPGEDQASWLRLLYRLEERGLRAQRGLSLFIHDGAEGLIAALSQAFGQVPHQRCIFHKLRNVWQALLLPEGLSPDARRAYRQKLIRQAARIWQAPSAAEARRRFYTFCAAWRQEQPAAVGTLQRQFEDTLTFYRMMEHNRLWPARHLRTTSRLERLNRKVRARMRRAGAYHSPSGLQAMLIQVLGVF